MKDVPNHSARRFTTMLLLLLLAALVGCSSSVTPPSTVAARPVLVLWHAWSGAEAQALQQLADEFNRTAAVQLIIQARAPIALAGDLNSSVSDGSAPHLAIVQSHLLGSFADEQVIQPVDDLLAAETRVALLSSALAAARVDSADGRLLYGIPLTFDTLALYYTSASIRRAPTDTGALLAAGRDLSAPQTTPPIWGLAYTLSLERTLAYLYAYGGSIFDETGAVVLGSDGRAGSEAWLSWLLDLYRDELVLASLDGVVVDRALAARQALMVIDWAHAQADYEAIWGDQLGVALLPRLSETGRAAQPLVQSDVLVLTRRLTDDAQRQAAAAFAALLLSDQGQTALLLAGRQPVLASLELNERDGLAETRLNAARTFRLAAQQGIAMPNSRLANEHLWTILSDMQNSVMRGLLTPEQAVTNADAALRSRFGR